MTAFASRLARADMQGLHLALNVLVGATLLWVLLLGHAGLNPIWAISSMLAASDPKVDESLKFFRGRLLNAFVGCATGLLILLVGGHSDWKLPLALSASVLVSTYVVQVPVMWRQAPITASIVVASGLTGPSKILGVEQGFKRVFEVILGCVVGLMVTFLMSKVWPVAPAERRNA